MLSYEPLWQTMEEKGVTTYTLREKAGIGGGTIQRLRNNETVSSNTFDVLCNFLDCRIEDIVEFKKDAPCQT